MQDISIRQMQDSIGGLEVVVINVCEWIIVKIYVLIGEY